VRPARTRRDVGGEWARLNAAPAIPWWLAGAALSPYLRALANAMPPRSIGEAIVDGALTGWYGSLAGVTFSVVLTLAGRRRVVHDLTPLRIGGYALFSSELLMGPPMVFMLAGRADGWREQDIVYLAGGVVLTVFCAVATLLAARGAAVTDAPTPSMRTT